MPDLLAGSTVRALDTPPTVSDVADPSYSFTITTYGTAITTGTYDEVAVVFMAPTSGRVIIFLSARTDNSTTERTLVCPETRNGSVIGAGGIVDAVGDRGPGGEGTSFMRMGTSRLLTDLTPGEMYNTRVLHKCTGGTGSVALRELIVMPVP